MRNVFYPNMLTVLYRGKRMDNGEWVEGHLFTLKMYESDADHVFILPSDTIYNNDNLLLQAVEVLPETVGQYIGRNDKNDRKIFCGDRVLYPDAPDYNDYNEDYNEGVVDWDEESMCFYFTERWSVNMEDFEVVDGKMIDVLVIGTIHDRDEAYNA